MTRRYGLSACALYGSRMFKVSACDFMFNSSTLRSFAHCGALGSPGLSENSGAVSASTQMSEKLGRAKGLKSETNKYTPED